MCSSENEGWLQIRETKCGINLPFPEGAVTHSSTHIDKCIVYPPNVFVLVNKCSSQVNCEYSIHFLLCLSLMCYTHTPYSSWDRSSVRHIISYGVSTPADVTVSFIRYSGSSLNCTKGNSNRWIKAQVIWWRCTRPYNQVMTLIDSASQGKRVDDSSSLRTARVELYKDSMNI